MSVWLDIDLLQVQPFIKIRKKEVLGNSLYKFKISKKKIKRKKNVFNSI